MEMPGSGTFLTPISGPVSRWPLPDLGLRWGWGGVGGSAELQLPEASVATCLSFFSSSLPDSQQGTVGENIYKRFISKNSSLEVGIFDIISFFMNKCASFFSAPLRL